MIKQVRVTCESIVVFETDSDEDEVCDLYGNLYALRLASGEQTVETRNFWHRGDGDDDFQGIRVGDANRVGVNTSHEMLILRGESLALGGHLNDYDPISNDHLGHPLRRITYGEIGNNTYTLDFTGEGGHVQVVYKTELMREFL